MRWKFLLRSSWVHAHPVDLGIPLLRTCKYKHTLQTLKSLCSKIVSASKRCKLWNPSASNCKYMHTMVRTWTEWKRGQSESVDRVRTWTEWEREQSEDVDRVRTRTEWGRKAHSTYLIWRLCSCNNKCVAKCERSHQSEEEEFSQGYPVLAIKVAPNCCLAWRWVSLST